MVLTNTDEVLIKCLRESKGYSVHATSDRFSEKELETRIELKQRLNWVVREESLFTSSQITILDGPKITCFARKRFLAALTSLVG